MWNRKVRSLKSAKFCTRKINIHLVLKSSIAVKATGTMDYSYCQRVFSCYRCNNAGRSVKVAVFIPQRRESGFEKKLIDRQWRQTITVWRSTQIASPSLWEPQAWYRKPSIWFMVIVPLLMSSPVMRIVWFNRGTSQDSTIVDQHT